MAETVQGDVEVATFCTSNRPLSHILTGSIPSDSASPLRGFLRLGRRTCFNRRLRQRRPQLAAFDISSFHRPSFLQGRALQGVSGLGWYRQTYAWVLERSPILKRPVPYQHPSG